MVNLAYIPKADFRLDRASDPAVSKIPRFCPDLHPAFFNKFRPDWHQGSPGLSAHLPLPGVLRTALGYSNTWPWILYPS